MYIFIEILMMIYQYDLHFPINNTQNKNKAVLNFAEEIYLTI